MKLFISASLMVLTLVSATAGVLADGSKGPTYEGRMLRRREEQSRKATADQLRFERARMRARQRMEQEAWNERTGRTPLRPYTNVPHWALGVGAGGR